MEQLQFSIYQSPDGDCPFEDWYETLPKKDAAKFDAIIGRVETYGIATALKMQWVKRLDGEIWELRSKFSNNIQRACYFHIQDGKYVITHGFTKKTQKTPQKEIDKAHTIKQSFMLEQERRT